MRIITLHHAEWPEEPAFLLTAAHWQRMAGYGDGANEALLRAAALEDSFGIAEEARILEITPQRPPPEPHPASILLDIQDLLQFLHETGNISGIQRVQLGILAAMLQGRAGPRGGIASPSFQPSPMARSSPRGRRICRPCWPIAPAPGAMWRWPGPWSSSCAARPCASRPAAAPPS